MTRHIIAAVPLAMGHPFVLISPINAETFSAAMLLCLRAWDVITELWRTHTVSLLLTMLGVSSAPVTTAAQGSSFLLPYSGQTPKHSPEALAWWGSVSVQWHSAGIFPRVFHRAVQLHTICRKAFPFLNFPRHFFIGHEIHRLMIKLWKNPSIEELFSNSDLKLSRISLAYIHDL